jgi:hypothetical protein
LSNLAVVETAIATTAVGFTEVPAGRYYVRIRGVNVQGAGPISNEVRIDVLR